MNLGTLLTLIYLIQCIPIQEPKKSRQFYHPKTIQQTFLRNSTVDEQTVVEAVEYGKQRLLNYLGLQDHQLKISQYHRDSAGVTHLYCLHLVNNIPVDNHLASIHIKGGQVLAFSASFTASQELSKRFVASKPDVILDDAIDAAVRKLGASRDNVPIKQAYLETKAGKLAFVHQFQLRNDSSGVWVQVSVDSSDGQIIQVVDYVQKASYRVIKLPNLDPFDGFDQVINPADPVASPLGWHDETYQTKGNNVRSRIQTFLRTSYMSYGGPSLKFEAFWNLSGEPHSNSGRNAAIINSFYVANMMHDISYQYGFDEECGNFQKDNFGKGGLEDDQLLINNQLKGSKRTPTFGCAPDGQQPIMNLCLWDSNQPPIRDSSLDNSIIIHEYAHGITSRLTGGSLQGNCLQTNEALGLGEGWSDAFALFLLRKPEDTIKTRAVVGQYISDRVTGVRSKAYSTKMWLRSHTYARLASHDDIYVIGEVWATMLYELYWNLVETHGFTTDYMDAKQMKGNVMALQIVIAGLKIQPCQPTFVTARDAILTADFSYYGGWNKCRIWQAFAKRGLGLGAVSEVYRNNFDLPTECAEI